MSFPGERATIDFQEKVNGERGGDGLRVLVFNSGAHIIFDGFEITAFIFSIPAIVLIVLAVIRSFLCKGGCKLCTIVKNL